MAFPLAQVRSLLKRVIQLRSTIYNVRMLHLLFTYLLILSGVYHNHEILYHV